MFHIWEECRCPLDWMGGGSICPKWVWGGWQAPLSNRTCSLGRGCHYQQRETATDHFAASIGFLFIGLVKCVAFDTFQISVACMYQLCNFCHLWWVEARRGPRWATFLRDEGKGGDYWGPREKGGRIPLWANLITRVHLPGEKNKTVKSKSGPKISFRSVGCKSGCLDLAVYTVSDCVYNVWGHGRVGGQGVCSSLFEAFRSRSKALLSSSE